MSFHLLALSFTAAGRSINYDPVLKGTIKFNPTFTSLSAIPLAELKYFTPVSNDNHEAIKNRTPTIARHVRLIKTCLLWILWNRLNFTHQKGFIVCGNG